MYPLSTLQPPQPGDVRPPHVERERLLMQCVELVEPKLPLNRTRNLERRLREGDARQRHAALGEHVLQGRLGLGAAWRRIRHLAQRAQGGLQKPELWSGLERTDVPLWPESALRRAGSVPGHARVAGGGHAAREG